MKKIVTFLLLLAMTLPVTSCNNKQENSSQPESSVQQESSITTESNTAETEQPQTISPTKLTNKMTETELSRVDKHELTLLDVPQEPTTEAEPAQTEHKVSVEFHTPSIDEWRENIESYRDQMTNEEYEAAMENIRIAEEKGENGGNPHPSIILVDGHIVPYVIPNMIDPDYDGGRFEFTSTIINENGEPEYEEEMSFESFEEYLDWIRKKDVECGYSDEMIEQERIEYRSAWFEYINENRD